MQALIEKIIPAYPYTQYNADPNIVAFFTAYNTLAQGYLDYLNALNLPCWTSPSITGSCWIGSRSAFTGKGGHYCKYLRMRSPAVLITPSSTTPFLMPA